MARRAVHLHGCASPSEAPPALAYVPHMLEHLGDGSPVPPREPGAPSLQPSARGGTGRRRSRLDPVGPPLPEAEGEPAGPDRSARRPPANAHRRTSHRVGSRGIRGGDPCRRPPPSPAAPARPRRPAPRLERHAHRAGDGGQIPLRRHRRRILLSVRPSGALRAVPRPGAAGRRGDRGDRDLAQFHRRVRAPRDSRGDRQRPVVEALVRQVHAVPVVLRPHSPDASDDLGPDRPRMRSGSSRWGPRGRSSPWGGT